MAKPRLTLSEEIALLHLLHELTAHELTLAVNAANALGYEDVGKKLLALRDALFPEEGDNDAEVPQADT